MRIVALRHGYAGDPDPALWPDDSERPLTPKGARKLAKAAKGMPHVATPSKVYASPSLRTWQTAQIMHEQAGWPESKKAGWLEDDTPPADAMKAIQRAHAKGTRSIGIVGHGPSLEALLTFMLTGKQGNASNLHLKKGGAAVVDYHGAPGNADLHELLTRKDIARRGKA